MMMKRRQFLKQSALGLGALVLTPRLVRAQEVPARFYDPYEIVPLGKTRVKMSRMCLGTGMRGGKRESNHTRMGKEKFEGLIRGAFDRGLNTFDLADLYGTHPYVVPALKGIPREKFVIVSKMWFRPGGIPEPERPDANEVVDRFLKEIKTDYIDLFLLHCVTDADWNEKLKKQMDILAEYRSKGTVRALGVSCHSLEALKTAVKEPWVDSVHARINPFGMSMDGPADKVVPVLKDLHQAGKGVVGMKIVGEGRLRNEPAKLDESIKFVLELGCVDVLNVGCESLQEVDDFAARVKKVRKAA
jgi:aryl-alcohol dehydrogenase-like predicted oxidoreductase